jgi:hypothetical protein|tara:strand:- start:4194 stop:4736 length:543 start_codon:yes stop_codon:yes gene_type:complete
MESKKGQIESILIMVAILFLLLFVGLLLVFGTMTFDWVADEVVPEFLSIGNVGDANFTEYGGYTIQPVNTVIQSFTWLAGIFYFMGLIGCIGLAVSFRMIGNKWLVGFFFVCMFLLIVTSIFISNIYEEFYNDGTEVGARLHEQVLLSWLLLYSPMVMSVIGFVCGIIMFSGEFVEGGGI